MKMKPINIAILFFGLLLCHASNPRLNSNSFTSNRDTILVRKDFKKYFDNCHVQGTTVIYDNSRHNWIVSDKASAKEATLPASTFKIINLLIALETKTISSEHDIVKWPGSTDTIKYGYRPEIYHDITVKEAFEVSAGWAYVELARKIGKEKYKKYLKLCHYGNGNLSQKDPDFWNFGAFAISPMNQVEFIRKLYDEKLPFSKENMKTVKRIMLTEQQNGCIIYSKTGWTRDKGINTGWWVGYVESEKGVYFFATRLLQDRKINNPSFGNCRKEITKSIFQDLKIIE